MDNVTTITGRWTRRLPREQYGHAEAELSASTTVVGSADIGEAAAELLQTLKAVVTAELRLGDNTEAVEPTAEKKSQKKANPKAKAKPKAEKAKTEKAKANGADVPDDVPEETAKPNISTGEDRTDPDDFDVPSEDDDAALSMEDFRVPIMTLINQKLVTGAQVSEILAAYGAERTMDLPAVKREQVLADIQALANV